MQNRNVCSTVSSDTMAKIKPSSARHYDYNGKNYSDRNAMYYSCARTLRAPGCRSFTVITITKSATR